MKIQLWKRKNYNNTKYNLYIRYRVSQNKAKVESLKLWEWISPNNDIEKSHNKEIKISCEEILRRAKDDLENNRSNIKLEENNQYLFKNLFNEFSNINNTNAVFNFIRSNNNIEHLNIRDINQKFLERTKQNIEKKIRNNEIKGSTASKYWNNFKSVLININKLKLCEYPKVSGIKYKEEKKIKNVFSKKEIEKIKRAKFRNKEIKNAFLFSFYTGSKLKILEIIKWENIKNLKNKKYYIDVDYNKKKFVIPFGEKARKLLGKRKEKIKNVFKLKNSKKNKSKEFNRLMVISGINPQKKYRDGINTYVMKMYNKTKNVYLISSILGHNSIEKTKKEYTYMNEKDYISKILDIKIENTERIKEKKPKILFKKGNLLSYRKDTLQDTFKK